MSGHVWISAERVLAVLRPQNGTLHNTNHLTINGTLCYAMSPEAAASIAVVEAVQGAKSSARDERGEGEGAHGKL